TANPLNLWKKGDDMRIHHKPPVNPKGERKLQYLYSSRDEKLVVKQTRVTAMPALANSLCWCSSFWGEAEEELES
ncbi:hypothetical protein HispidOSU_026295, partial [Sigmodon hispidus]